VIHKETKKYSEFFNIILYYISNLEHPFFDQIGLESYTKYIRMQARYIHILSNVRLMRPRFDEAVSPVRSAR